jgi:uncharacterized protein YndB with AHSA1/START domain
VPGTETTAAVEVATRIDASPEAIFGFFTEPDKMIQWMGREAQLEPRPGGLFRCDINGRHIAAGTFLEVDPPHRVVFSFGWEGEESSVRPGASRIEVTLEPDGEGTNVRLVHSDLPTEDSAGSHRHGWEHYIERLAVAAPGDHPGEDPWANPERAGQ